MTVMNAKKKLCSQPLFRLLGILKYMRTNSSTALNMLLIFRTNVNLLLQTNFSEEFILKVRLTSFKLKDNS